MHRTNSIASMSTAGEESEDGAVKGRAPRAVLNARTRPTNNQLLYKAYFRWDHYPHKLRNHGDAQPNLPAETDPCASVTTAFLQVLSTLNNVEKAREDNRNILQLLSANTRRTKVVELNSGTHRVPEELRRHCLVDNEDLQYSTNLDRNRYGNDDQYLSTVIRYDLEFLSLCPCLVDVEIIDAKNGSGTILVSAGDDNCRCNHEPRLVDHKGRTTMPWGHMPPHKRNGVPVLLNSPVHGHQERRGSAGSHHSDAGPSLRCSLPDSSVPLLGAPTRSGSAFDMLLIAASAEDGNDGNCGHDGDDDMAHVGRAPSQEAAVTSRRQQQAHLPMSRSRLFTGSVGDDRRSYGDDPSLQNAVEAFHNFQEGGDEFGSDGGLTESPFQRLESVSRLPSARSRSRRLGMGTSLGGNGGGPSNTSPPHLPPASSGGMNGNGRQGMKPRMGITGRLGPRTTGSMGRGGETLGLAVSVDSGEGETGDKRDDMGIEVDGELELDNVVTGRYATVRTVQRQSSAVNLLAFSPRDEVRRLQDEVRRLKNERDCVMQQLEEARAKELEAMRKVDEASKDANQSKEATKRHQDLVSQLRMESHTLMCEKDEAVQCSRDREQQYNELQGEVAGYRAALAALASVPAAPGSAAEQDANHLRNRLHAAVLKSAQLEAENLQMKQQLSSSKSAAPQGFTPYFRGPQPQPNSSPHTPSRPALVAAEISPPVGSSHEPAALATQLKDEHKMHPPGEATVAVASAAPDTARPMVCVQASRGLVPLAGKRKVSGSRCSSSEGAKRLALSSGDGDWRGTEEGGSQGVGLGRPDDSLQSSSTGDSGNGALELGLAQDTRTPTPVPPSLPTSTQS